MNDFCAIHVFFTCDSYDSFIFMWFLCNSFAFHMRFLSDSLFTWFLHMICLLSHVICSHMISSFCRWLIYCSRDLYMIHLFQTSFLHTIHLFPHLIVSDDSCSFVTCSLDCVILFVRCDFLRHTLFVLFRCAVVKCTFTSFMHVVYIVTHDSCVICL